MECAEARRLIDAGVRPGSGSTQRASLGFHLSRCPGCRAYLAAEGRANREEDGPRHAQPDRFPVGEYSSPSDLLADLLAAAPAPSPARRPPPPRPLPRRRPSRRRPLVLGLGVLLIGVAGLFVGRLAYAAYQIRSNLAAMGVAPTPALDMPTWAGGVADVGVADVGAAGGAQSAAPRPPQLAVASPSPRRPSVTAAPALATAAAIPAGDDPPPPPGASAAPGPPFVPSATPVRLPAIDVGLAALPTLMPTINVIPPRGRPITILLLGSDRRPGEGWAARSDAIMLARLEPATQRIALLSLPRDLVVSIPGYGQARINAATAYGEGDPGGSIELARRTVSDLVGLPIDYVVRADFGAFTTAVDAIGGVDVLVDEPIYDGAYPTMDYGYTEVSFEPGLQWMDGATALVYSRVRHGDSNYARNRRQQQVILAILQKVRDQNILAQVEMLTDLTAAVRDDIQTDLTPEQMLGLAWAMRDVAPAAVERYALDETMVTEGVLADDPYATFPMPGAIDALVRRFVGGQRAAP